MKIELNKTCLMQIKNISLKLLNYNNTTKINGAFLFWSKIIIIISKKNFKLVSLIINHESFVSIRTICNSRFKTKFLKKVICGYFWICLCEINVF